MEQLANSELNSIHANELPFLYRTIVLWYAGLCGTFFNELGFPPEPSRTGIYRILSSNAGFVVLLVSPDVALVTNHHTGADGQNVIGVVPLSTFGFKGVAAGGDQANQVKYRALSRWRATGRFPGSVAGHHVRPGLASSTGRASLRTTSGQTEKVSTSMLIMTVSRCIQERCFGSSTAITRSA